MSYRLSSLTAPRDLDEHNAKGRKALRRRCFSPWKPHETSDPTRGTSLWAHANDCPQEKAKRSAWSKLVDEKVSAADAQKRYVKLVKELKEKHGYNA